MDNDFDPQTGEPVYGQQQYGQQQYGQQQYEQQQYGQQPLQPPYGQPAYDNQVQYQAYTQNQEQKKNGTVHCVISLVLRLSAPFIVLIIAGLLGTGDISSFNWGASVFSFIYYIGAHIASWVLAIVALAKYKSKFGLVLVIIYSAFIVIGIIGFFAVLFWIGSTF